MTETNAPHPVRPHTPGGGAVEAESHGCVACGATFARSYADCPSCGAEESIATAPVAAGEVEVREGVRVLAAALGAERAQRGTRQDTDTALVHLNATIRALVGRAREGEARLEASWLVADSHKMVGELWRAAHGRACDQLAAAEGRLDWIEEGSARHGVSVSITALRLDAGWERDMVHIAHGTGDAYGANIRAAIDAARVAEVGGDHAD